VFGRRREPVRETEKQVVPPIGETFSLDQVLVHLWLRPVVAFEFDIARLGERLHLAVERTFEPLERATDEPKCGRHALTMDRPDKEDCGGQEC
jgi:hypothetical protein